MIFLDYFRFIDKYNKKRILDICSKTKYNLKIIPEVYSLLLKDMKTDVLNKICDVQVEDLLGCDTIKLHMTQEYIKGKTVLITDTGGSIGSELCRQISSYESKKLIICFGRQKP